MSGGAHALVTGGGSGIGQAIAASLAASGRRVTLLGRDPGRLEKARTEIPGAIALPCDVTDEDAVRSVLAESSARHGPVEVLVNCAGSVTTARFEKTGSDVWSNLWRVNVLGAVHTAQAALPAMRAIGRGRIINIASTAALKPYAYTSAYTSAKHALLGMTRALALELADTAITVNAICPGYTDTAIMREAVANIVARTGRTENEAMATFTASNPQGRLIDPEEIAATVMWLVSPEARSVTGQAIVVAGGEIM